MKSTVLHLFALLCICLVIPSSCSKNPEVNPIRPERYTKIEALKLLDKSTEDGRKAYWQIQEFNAQVMVLTLSLSVTIFGFIFSRGKGRLNDKEKSYGMFLVAGFCFMMYGLTVQQNDVSLRIQKKTAQIHAFLLQGDSLSASQLDSAMVKAYEGIGPPDQKAKLHSLYYPGLVSGFWFGVPTILALLCGTWYQRQNKLIIGSVAIFFIGLLAVYLVTRP